MAARTPLFRLFLAAILILNGVASAMAAVQHDVGPGVPAETSTSEAAEVDQAAGGAHDGCDELDPGIAGKDAPVIGGTHGTGPSPGPDCCESGACQCACVNAGVPVLPSVVHDGFGIPGPTGAPATASWHVAPALPHLMRPPIS